MKIDFTDGTLFGNDAGEDEQPDILNSYFVDQQGFQNFLSHANTFRVARSRKGMGKSALLSKLGYDLSLSTEKPIVVKITGTNLIGLIAPPKNEAHLQVQNYWLRVLITRMNYAVAAHFGFSFSDRNNAIVDSAELTGVAETNIVQFLLKRIHSQKIPIELSSRIDTTNEHSSEDIFAAPPSKDIWLLIDDIDSTYVDTEELQTLTSTFFSACRALVRDTQGLYIRASVRTDVWSNLRKNEDLDKCEQYVTDISWSASDMNIILSKKVYSYVLRKEPAHPKMIDMDYRKDAGAIMEYAFERKMRWGASMVPPFRPVYILSAGRPRWMSQLCRLAGVQAAKQQRERIGTTEINYVSKTYSHFRLNDIYKEHAHQYAGLQKLIEAFSNSPSLYNTHDLLSQIAKEYINHVGAGSVPEIDGYPYKRPLQLAHFIYKIGFIVGRRDQNVGTASAEFVRYEERPELLHDARNPDDGLLWEVHPAYRSALTIGRTIKAAQGVEKDRSQKAASREASGRSKGRPLKASHEKTSKVLTESQASEETPPRRRRRRRGSGKSRRPNNSDS